MNLKAIFPTGITELTVNGLHQWDYGRKLEIHSPDLPAILEVHFACPSIDEAIVRVGSAVNGVVTVVIPDRCLEQSSPVTAWIYEVGETYGQTIKTLTLNIMARTRPQTSETLDPDNSDKYTEAVGAMNEAIKTLKDGDIKAKEAEHADKASSADNADKATNDSKGNNIANNYLRRHGGTMLGPTYYWGDPALPEFAADETPNSFIGVSDWKELNQETGLGGYPLKRVQPGNVKVGRATNDGEGNNIANSYLKRWGGTMTGPTYYWHTGDNPSLPEFGADDVPVACLGVGAWEDLNEETGLGGYPLKRLPNTWKKEDIMLHFSIADDETHDISWRDCNGLYAVKLIRCEDEAFQRIAYTFFISPEASMSITRSNTNIYISTPNPDETPYIMWLEYIHDAEKPQIKLKARNLLTGTEMTADSCHFDVYWKKVY